jgi:hypothetical protein
MLLAGGDCWRGFIVGLLPGPSRTGHASRERELFFEIVTLGRSGPLNPALQLKVFFNPPGFQVAD